MAPYWIGGGAVAALLLVALAATGGGGRTPAKKTTKTSAPQPLADKSGRVAEARRLADQGLEIISRQEARLHDRNLSLSDEERRQIAVDLDRGRSLLLEANQICEEVQTAGRSDQLPSEEMKKWNDFSKQASMDLRALR